MTKSVFSARYARFRRLLVNARKSAGITQETLAKRIGWEQTDVSKAERGVRRLDVVEFLSFAKGIGIDPAEFLRQLDSK